MSNGRLKLAGSPAAVTSTTIFEPYGCGKDAREKPYIEAAYVLLSASERSLLALLMPCRCDFGERQPAQNRSCRVRKRIFRAVQTLSASRGSVMHITDFFFGGRTMARSINCQAPHPAWRGFQLGKTREG